MTEPAPYRTRRAPSDHDRIDRVLAERKRDEDRDVKRYRAGRRLGQNRRQHERHIGNCVEPSPAAARDAQPPRDSPVDEIAARGNYRDYRECQPSLMSMHGQLDPDCGQREPERAQAVGHLREHRGAATAAVFHLFTVSLASAEYSTIVALCPEKLPPRFRSSATLRHASTG